MAATTPVPAPATAPPIDPVALGWVISEALRQGVRLELWAPDDGLPRAVLLPAPAAAREQLRRLGAVSGRVLQRPGCVSSASVQIVDRRGAPLAVLRPAGGASLLWRVLLTAALAASVQEEDHAA